MHPEEDCNARAQTFSRGQHCYLSMKTGARLLRYALPVTRTTEMLGLVAPKFDRFQLYATSANIVVVPCLTDTRC